MPPLVASSRALAERNSTPRLDALRANSEYEPLHGDTPPKPPPATSPGPTRDQAAAVDTMDGVGRAEAQPFAVGLGAERSGEKPLSRDRRDTRSGSLVHDQEAELARQRTLRQRLLSDLHEQTLATTVQKRSRRALVMPPNWFLPHSTYQHHIDRVKSRVQIHDVKVMPTRCGEEWLHAAVFSHLDTTAVRLCTYLILGSMAILHPTLVVGYLGPIDSLATEQSQSLPVWLHAIGVALPWLCALRMFCNLREVVRLRVSWLRFIMAKVGVTTEDFQALGFSKAKAKELINDEHAITTTRDVYTAAIARRCDQIERNDKAASLCEAAQAAIDDDPEKSKRLFRRAAELDPESKSKTDRRIRDKEERIKREKVADLRREASEAEKSGEFGVARDKYAEADRLCPECQLTKQSTVARRAEHAERVALQRSLDERSSGWSSCLDRPYVQMEIRWAWQYKKPIVIMVEKSREREEFGFFDFARAREKYRGTEWEKLLQIDAIEYHRDDDHAMVMVQKILKRSSNHHVPVAARHHMNHPGRWDFFLSHAQTTGGDQAQTTSFRLQQADKTCWYDRAMDDKSTEAMEEGVRGCGTFLLFLTARKQPDWASSSVELASQDRKVQLVARLQARFRGNQSRAIDSRSKSQLPYIFNELHRLHVQDVEKSISTTSRRGHQFVEVPQQQDDVETSLPHSEEPHYVPLSAEGLQSFRSFLSARQDIMPPERRLGAVREAPAGYHLARLRWSAYQVTSSANVSGQRGRQEHTLRTLSHKTYNLLQTERYCTCIFGVVVWSLFVGLHLQMFVENGLNRSVLSYLVAAYCTLASLLALMVYTAWFLSLLLATSLAMDAVNDLRAVVSKYSPARGDLSHGVQYRQDYQKGNWYEVVQRPCLELVNGTLPSLSAWGSTVAMVVVTSWSFVLLSMPLAVHEYDSNQALAWNARIFVAMCIGLVSPLVTMYVPVTVSSSVVKLLGQLNELYIRSEVSDQNALRRMDRAAHLFAYGCTAASLCIGSLEMQHICPAGFTGVVHVSWLCLRYVRNVNNTRGPGFMIGEHVIHLSVFWQSTVGFLLLSATLCYYLRTSTGHGGDLALSLDDQRSVLQMQAAILNCSVVC